MTYQPPPPGWFNFGHHANDRNAHPVEFSEETGPDGLPRWERPLPAPEGVRFGYADGTAGPAVVRYVGTDEHGINLWFVEPVEHRPEAVVVGIAADTIPANSGLKFALHPDGRVA